MEESSIKKTAFRVRSSRFHEFTRMLFGLSNAGSSCCCFMKQCPSNQQFITLFLYLDGICNFSLDICAMIDHIEMAFSGLKNFSLRLSWINARYLLIVMCFMVVFYQPFPKNSEGKKLAHSKECQKGALFLHLVSYYRHFINHFTNKAQCLHDLIGPIMSKSKGYGKIKNKNRC